jgi:hypothetical protein
VDELAAVAYPGINQVEKKHRVAVLRAAAAAAQTCGWWYGQAQQPGHSMIYGNPLDLSSTFRNSGGETESLQESI